MKHLLAAAVLSAAAALSGCQVREPLAGGTVVSVREVSRDAEPEELPRYYEHPLVPEVAWQIEVRLDDGAAVTVTRQGTRRYQPGERVRLLIDDEGALLL